MRKLRLLLRYETDYVFSVLRPLDLNQWQGTVRSKSRQIFGLLMQVLASTQSLLRHPMLRQTQSRRGEIG